MIKFIIVSLILIFVVARFFDYLLYIVRLLSGREEDASTFQKKTKKKEGEVEVQFNTDNRKRKPFSGGEYIDFEEIKENNPDNK